MTHKIETFCYPWYHTRRVRKSIFWFWFQLQTELTWKSVGTPFLALSDESCVKGCFRRKKKNSFFFSYFFHVFSLNVVLRIECIHAKSLVAFLSKVPHDCDISSLRKKKQAHKCIIFFKVFLISNMSIKKWTFTRCIIIVVVMPFKCS